MDPENKAATYKKLVAEVKAEMAKKPHTGDETQHEIAKRWAKANDRPFDAEPPVPAVKTPTTTAPIAAVEAPKIVGGKAPKGSKLLKPGKALLSSGS